MQKQTKKYKYTTGVYGHRWLGRIFLNKGVSMPMTPRDIIRRTVDFDFPERVAHTFNPSDLIGVRYKVKTGATDWKETGGGRWERMDEWGNMWARVDPTSKGEVVKGAIDSPDGIDGYNPPDFSKPEYYAEARETREKNPDMWVQGSIPGYTFNCARYLRRIDNYLMDLVTHPGRVHALHDRIDAFLEAIIRNYGKIGCDCIGFAEDWGTQNKLFISPKLWRKEFGPRFEKLSSLAHSYKMKIFMHSCGMNESVVPDMISAGIDCFQFDQPELHGLGTLAGHQKKAKVTFWSPIDIQTTLQSKDERTIRAAAREYLDKLWDGRGGFIAGYYGDNASIGLEPKWQNIASDEFLKYGVADNFKRE
jgi:uroporphyrinogen decarboxylase